MSTKYLLKYRNLDLTRDINERFTSLIVPGIMKGGEVSVIPSQLKVNIAPWKIFNRQGLVVEETSESTVLTVVAGQENVIALKVLYYQNQAPIAQFEVMDIGVFNGLPNSEDYIVFCHVQVPLTATEVIEDYVDLIPRNVIDPISRNNIRGTLNTPSLLPDRNNLKGDLYFVTDGVGGPVDMYGWNGFTWINMTDVIALQATLTQHRQNLFANEKHLTDAEKLATQGTSGAPSDTNRFVTDSDTRIPTQDENNALVGSHGSPSTTNKYITQALQFSQPSSINVSATTNPMPVSILQGPVYLGRSGVDSYQRYFKLYHATEDREYLNSNSSVVDIEGVYKDAGLTNRIDDPSSEALTVIDENGFYIDGTLYIKFSSTPDLDARLLFGKRSTLGTYRIDMLMDNQPRTAQTNRDVIKKFEELSGIKYDEVLPEDSNNTNLKAELKDVKQYINVNTSSDMVVSDFKKINSIPEYNGMFEENVGLKSFTFENTNSLPYSYDYNTGRVTYTGTPDLSNVVVNNVFIDGKGIEYKITAKGSNSVDILNRKGVKPNSISESITKVDHGSIKLDNNPRQINLADMKLVQFRERIPVARVQPIENEFHPISGQLAFEIADPLRSLIFRENRVRMYGNCQVRNTTNPLAGPNAGPKTQVYFVNSARILVTGHFTDLELIADCNDLSPTVSVIVDGGTPYNVDLSNGGNEVSFDTFNEIKQKNYVIASDLSDSDAHTVEIIIPDAVPEFVFYGLDLIRRNYEQANLLSGRAFVQGDLVSQDSVEVLTMNPTPALSRGGIASVLYNRELQLKNNLVESTEFDGVIGSPGGSAVLGSNTFPVTFGLTKFNQYYKIKDVVKVVTATEEETKIIDNISGSLITFDSPLSINGVANLIHICSIVEDSYDKEIEARRVSASLTGLATVAEFEQFPSLIVDRIGVLEDGVTRIMANQISFVATNVEGADRALNFPNVSSRMRISACCSSMDILVANDSDVAFQYTINGSSIIDKSSTDSGYRRIRLFANGRFQTWEIDIFNATGLNIAGFIFMEPDSEKESGLEIGEIKYLARYQSTNPSSNGIIEGANYPIGSVAFDAYSSFVRFVKGIGTGWSTSIDFSKLYGRYTATKDTNGYFEYTTYGTSVIFEYTATSDSGYALVLLNGVVARTSNFPVVYKGMSFSNGVIDMYSATPERRRIEISDLPFGKYTVKVQVVSPFSKNPLSSDFFINVNQIFFANSTGLFGYANELAKSSSYYLGYSNQYDKRDFGNGTASFDDLVGVVGDAYGLSTTKEAEDTVIDGGTFI